MNMVFEGEYGKHIRRGLIAVLVLLALFLAVKTLAEIQGFRYIGAGLPPSNVITITGEGESFIVPDLAEFTYSVVSKKATVSAAQQEVTTKSDAIIAFLTGEGVEEKDIKTVGYNVYPSYEWEQAVCPAVSGGREISYCPPGRQILTGYEVRMSIQVKVRDTERAGEFLSGVGSKGATEVSGLTFTIDDEDTVREQARSQAIADAKAKADELESELGVRLGRIVSFNEYTNGGQPPMPYYGYGKGGDFSVAEQARDASVPTGENKFVSNVTITYEIR